VAARTQKTIGWLRTLVDFPEPPPLFVIGPEDWDRIALIPQYGLPHVNHTRIVTAQEPSGAWTALLERVWPALPDSDRERLRRVYGTPPELGAFADLIVAHELTHLTDGHNTDGGATSERDLLDEARLLWFTELFANLGLHGYIVECEPEAQLILETLFEVIGSTAPAQWPLHQLDEMYESFTAPGQDGTNYMWFQFRLQMLAKRLWEAAGGAGFQRIHAILRGPVPDDAEIVALLATMDQTVADDVRRWARGNSEPFGS
jgi:hypothetical protein